MKKTADDLIAVSKVRARCLDGTARQIRLAHRLSLAEMALPLDVQPITVLRWERAERLPRGDLALRYGSLLDALLGQAVQQ
jgi:hypothetical protein